MLSQQVWPTRTSRPLLECRGMLVDFESSPLVKDAGLAERWGSLIDVGG